MPKTVNDADLPALRTACESACAVWLRQTGSMRRIIKREKVVDA